MPTNTVEQCLSDTADYFEGRLSGDPALGNEFEALLKAGKKPFVFRMLDNVLPAGYMLTVSVSPQPT